MGGRGAAYCRSQWAKAVHNPRLPGALRATTRIAPTMGCVCALGALRVAWQGSHRGGSIGGAEKKPLARALWRDARPRICGKHASWNFVTGAASSSAPPVFQAAESHATSGHSRSRTQGHSKLVIKTYLWC